MFYDELKDLRRTKGFTIREVADRSGVSNAYISQLENGQRGVPSPDILQKLSDGLETSYSTLMRMAGYMEEDDSHAKKPANLRRFLREYEWVLDGRPLSEADIRRIDRMLTIMFQDD